MYFFCNETARCTVPHLQLCRQTQRGEAWRREWLDHRSPTGTGQESPSGPPTRGYLPPHRNGRGRYKRAKEKLPDGESNSDLPRASRKWVTSEHTSRYTIRNALYEGRETVGLHGSAHGYKCCIARIGARSAIRRAGLLVLCDCAGSVKSERLVREARSLEWKLIEERGKDNRDGDVIGEGRGRGMSGSSLAQV